MDFERGRPDKRNLNEDERILRVRSASPFRPVVYLPTNSGYGNSNPVSIISYEYKQEIVRRSSSAPPLSRNKKHTIHYGMRPVSRPRPGSDFANPEKIESILNHFKELDLTKNTTAYQKWVAKKKSAGEFDRIHNPKPIETITNHRFISSKDPEVVFREWKLKKSKLEQAKRIEAQKLKEQEQKKLEEIESKKLLQKEKNEKALEKWRAQKQQEKERDDIIKQKRTIKLEQEKKKRKAQSREAFKNWKNLHPDPTKSTMTYRPYNHTQPWENILPPPESINSSFDNDSKTKLNSSKSIDELNSPPLLFKDYQRVKELCGSRYIMKYPLQVGSFGRPTKN